MGEKSRMKIVKIPYQITANGVYRCVKYLANVTFYADENGWCCESEDLKMLFISLNSKMDF